MKCLKCDWEGNPNLEETGPHTKATCPKCKAYIKFVGEDELGEIVNRTMSKSMMKRLIIQKAPTRKR
jgi:hypothetical protein